MIPYLFTFFISLFFFHFGTMCLRNRDYIVSSLLYSFSISFPILLAACRSETIGTDVQNYVRPYFDLIANQGGHLLDAIKYIGYVEPGYIAINWIVSCFSHDIFWLFFLIQLIILVPIYLGAIKVRKNCSPTLIIFLYYCILYNESFNLVRQSIALSICFLAFSFILSKKKWHCLILIIISSFFHTSSLLFLLFFLLYLSYTSKFYIKHRLFINVVATLILVLFLFLPHLIDSLVISNIIKAKYIVYSSGGNFEGRLQKSAFIYKSIILLYIYIFRNYKFFSKRRAGLFFLFIAICDLALCLIGSSVIYLSRISLYTFSLTMFAIASIYFSKKLKSVYNFDFVICFLSVLYWFFNFVISGVSDTYPYKSPILGMNIW